MTKEDYVSYDVAIMLRDVNYNVPCTSMYDSNMNEIQYDCCLIDWNHRMWNGKYIKDFMSIPSLYEVQKWFREVHRIYICPTPYDKYWDVNLYELIDNDEECHYKFLDSSVAWQSYEEALNNGIKKALKYIN